MLPTYWLVEVREEPDVERNIPGYTRRFRFEGPDGPSRAFECWSAAERNGFTARVEQCHETKRERAIP